MKNIILLLIIILPILGFSQNITGTWTDKSGDIGMKFNSNGSFNLVDLKSPEKKILKNEMTYKLTVENGINYITFSMFRNGQLVKEEKNKYKIENNKLYLPITSTDNNGKVTVYDYKSVLHKL